MDDMLKSEDSCMPHALPAEVITILDATARFLAQLTRDAQVGTELFVLPEETARCLASLTPDTVLPPAWHAEAAVLLGQVQRVLALHVWREREEVSHEQT